MASRCSGGSDSTAVRCSAPQRPGGNRSTGDDGVAKSRDGRTEQRLIASIRINHVDALSVFAGSGVASQNQRLSRGACLRREGNTRGSGFAERLGLDTVDVATQSWHPPPPARHSELWKAEQPADFLLIGSQRRICFCAANALPAAIVANDRGAAHLYSCGWSAGFMLSASTGSPQPSPFTTSSCETRRRPAF